jgi:hypothetical protein
MVPIISVGQVSKKFIEHGYEWEDYVYVQAKSSDIKWCPEFVYCFPIDVFERISRLDAKASRSKY